MLNPPEGKVGRLKPPEGKVGRLKGGRVGTLTPGAGVTLFIKEFRLLTAF